MPWRNEFFALLVDTDMQSASGIVAVVNVIRVVIERMVQDIVRDNANPENVVKGIHGIGNHAPLWCHIGVSLMTKIV